MIVAFMYQIFARDENAYYITGVNISDAAERFLRIYENKQVDDIQNITIIGTVSFLNGEASVALERTFFTINGVTHQIKHNINSLKCKIQV